MQCSKCNAPTDNESVYCGQCGKQFTYPGTPVTVVYAADLPLPGQSAAQWPNDEKIDEMPGAYPSARLAPQSFPKTPAPQAARLVRPSAAFPTRLKASRRARSTGKATSITFFTVMLVLLLIGILVGAVTLFQNKHITNNAKMTNSAMGIDRKGSVTFSDSQSNTDSLTVSISGLKDPDTGAHYTAWMVNEATEKTSLLGVIQPSTGKGQSYDLNVTNKATNLLGLGNKLEITEETSNATLPTGQVVLLGRFPELAFVHIKHLLVSFPSTPGNSGLLVGLRGQAQLVQAQAGLLKNVAGQREATVCAAQSMLNLIEGKHGIATRLLAPGCGGFNVTVSNDGFGLLGSQSGDGYVPYVAAHASLAATQTDATGVIRGHAQQVVLSMDKLKGWLGTMVQDAQMLVNDPGATAQFQELITLADNVLNGTNHDDGVNGAYLQGQAMATLTLAPLSS